MRLDIDKDGFVMDGQRRFLFSGEFHYFRVPETDWRTRLRLWKEADGNMVATYVPWLIHEPEEGHFDLERLRRFLDTVADEKLFLLVRPGPYQYSELLNDGLPSWLLENYPQIHACDRNGRHFRAASISYLHPVFLEKTEAYFDHVCPLLAEYTVEKGGPIAICQADNELFGIHVWFGGVDFNPETYGFGREDGLYAAYLKRRFKDVAVLNERYHTSHQAFGEFSPADEPAGGLEKLLWNRDYYDCYLESGALYLDKLLAMMEKDGINCRFCHNSAGPGMDSMFRESKQRLGNKLLIGTDHYYNLNQSWSQNNPTPQYLVGSFISHEVLRLMDNPPTVLEFPYGSSSDWPPMTPEDLEACLYLHLATGVKGVNGYVYTGGPNVPGTGVTTDLYDYSAPIGPFGEIRPTYGRLKAFGRFLQEHPELATAEGRHDFQILLPWNAARAQGSWPAPNVEGTMKETDLWAFIRQGLVTSAFAAGLLPQFTTWEQADETMPLVLPCSGAMSRDDQCHAVDFLKRGGKLLCLPLMPVVDDDYRPCTLLRDFVGGGGGKLLFPRDYQPRLHLGDLANVFINNGFVLSEQLPPQGEKLGWDELSGKTVCWKAAAGKGDFLYLGCWWLYTNREQHQALEFCLNQLGMKRFLKNSDSWVFAIPRGTLLFLCNLSTARRAVTITLCDSGVTKSFDIPPMTVEKWTMPTQQEPNETARS